MLFIILFFYKIIYISIASLLGLNLLAILGLILSIVFKRYSNFSLFIKFLNSFNSSKFLNIVPLLLVGFPNSSEGLILQLFLMEYF